MNRQETDLAEGALIKVQQMIENEELVVFTQAEAQALQEVATFWGQIKGVVALGSLLGKSLKWLIGMAAIWFAFKEGFFGWIQDGIK